MTEKGEGSSPTRAFEFVSLNHAVQALDCMALLVQ